MSDSSDDKNLWKDFTKGVKPIKPCDRVHGSISKSKKPGKGKKGPSEKPSLELPTLKDFSPETGADLRYSGRRRLKAPKEMDRTLDLHGMTQKEAYGALASCITRAFDQREKTVLVITGKGLRKKEGTFQQGVLRKNVPLWLNASTLRPFVVYYAEARPEDGGSGAYYVFLKTKR